MLAMLHLETSNGFGSFTLLHVNSLFIKIKINQANSSPQIKDSIM